MRFSFKEEKEVRKKTGSMKLVTVSAMLAISACLFTGMACAEEETDEAVFEELAENVPGETEQVEEETEAAITIPEYDVSECVELGEYLGLSLDPIEVTVTDVDVDMTIENTVKSRNLYDELTEGTVENGDIANIDYEGKIDDVAFEGGTAEGYDLEIGSGSFIPGFEEGLVGVSVGETTDLDVTFPEDYGNADYAGKAAVFTVTVNSIKRMPAMDDELAKKLSDGEYTAMAEYREAVREDIAGQMRDEESELVEKIVAGCERIEIPADLLDFYVEDNLRYAEQMYSYYGLSLEDVISSSGVTMDEYKEQVRLSVQESLEKQLVVEAVVKKEGLEVDDEAMAAGAQELAEKYGYGTADTLIAAVGEDAVRDRIAYEKALALIVESADIGEISILTGETESATEGMTE